MRTLALAELDEAGLRDLIAEGEPLFVERKVATPKDGLGPTVASFANTLGGWLLLGIADDATIRGFSEHGRSDLQDHLRHVLRGQVDPLPPFLARSFELDGKTVGVVRVIESSDTPHIVRKTGALYVREPGGRQPIRDHQTLTALAQRGEAARERAAERMRTLPMISEALQTPTELPEDRVWSLPAEQELPPVLEMIVMAAPLTLSAAFADRALSKTTTDWASEAVTRLWGLSPEKMGPHWTHPDAHARGFVVEGQMKGLPRLVTLAIDAGGVVAVRTAKRREGGTFLVRTLAEHNLPTMLGVIRDTLSHLDAHGRALVELRLRGIQHMQVQGGPNEVSYPKQDSLHIGGELPVPATDDDVRGLAERWAREFGRAAKLPHWEPVL